MHSITYLAGLSLALSLQTLQASQTDRNEHWIDVDADGRRDLVLLDVTGTPRLFLNDALAGLVEADSTWGFQGLGSHRGIAAGDADDDGLTDFFLFGGATRPVLLRHLGNTFAAVGEASGFERVGAIRDAAWLDIDDDGQIDLRVTPSAGGLGVFRNLGNFRFEWQVVVEGASAVTSSNATDTIAPDSANGSEPPAPDATATGSSSNSASASGTGSGTQAGTGTIYNPLGSPVSSATLPPSTMPWGCAREIVDQAGGPCLPASSVPMLNHLLPLGDKFFIDGFSRVGFNTTTPEANLHVQTGNIGSLRLSSQNLFGPASNSIQMALRHDYDDGMELATDDDGLGIYSRRPAQGGIPNTFGPHLFISRSAATKVGINEPDPEGVFHVGGTTIVDHNFIVRRADDFQTFKVEPNYVAGGGGARVFVSQSDGNHGIILDGENSANSGSKITMYGNNGSLRVELDADDAGSAFMRLYKSNNTVGITLDADQNGDARITTEVLEITGGADLVESFDTGDIECAPGTVVAIDPTRPGELTVSGCAYDTRVAGVVSGAGGVQPGLKMGQTGVASGSTPVALTGRVYVRSSNENGAIQPGDLLTTSSTPGVAMRATDSARSFGAVIGKAMTSLEGESGLVLVLVNLQ